MNEELKKAAAAAEQNDFEPKQIGESDYRKNASITNNYLKIVDALNQLKASLENCLKRTEPFPISDFMDFLRSDSAKWITYRHIEQNNFTYPGQDVDVLISLGTIKVDGMEKVFSDERKLAKALESLSNDSFYFPIDRLWDPETNGFTLTMSFVEESDKHCSRFTKSKEQNDILEIMQEVCNGLNKLADLNILRPQHGPTELSNLTYWIEVKDPLSHQNNKGVLLEPFTVSPVLFWRHRMGAWKIPGIEHSEHRNPETILNEVKIKTHRSITLD